jgi:HEAT repeat protein
MRGLFSIWRPAIVGFALVALPGIAGAQPFLGKSASEWVQELKDPQPSVRRSAAFALGKLGNRATSAVHPLLDLLQSDKDAGVREAAALAIGEIGSTSSRQVLPELRKLLVNKKEEAAVRRGVAFALGCYGPKADSAVPELVAAVSESEDLVRPSAAWALGRLGKKAGADGVRALCEALADKDDPLVRREAAAALGEIGREERAGTKRSEKEEPATREAVDPLLDCCRKETDTEVRKTALGALVNVVDARDKGTDRARGIQALLHKLQQNGGDPEEIREAALALGNIGGPEAASAVKVLCETLKDKEDDPHNRRLATAALAGIGPDGAEAVPDLAEALKDPDAQVRRNAALALGNMRERAEEAVPALVKLLDPRDPADDVRRYAMEALAFICEKPGDKVILESLPTLRKVIQEDPSWRVRQRVVWVLACLSNQELKNVVDDLKPVLAEKKAEPRLVRYEAAVLLGLRLGPDAPDKTLDVLLENLNDKEIRIYEGSGASVSGTGPEAKSGTGTVTENLAGDARFLPAKALGTIGAKANRPDIVDSLKEAAKAEDKKVSEAARDALKKITGS